MILSQSFNIGDKAIYIPTNEIVKVVNIDLSHNHIEVEFDDGAEVVLELKSLRLIVEVNRIDTLIDTFLSQYKNHDGTYTLPKIIIDKLINLGFKEVN